MRGRTEFAIAEENPVIVMNVEAGSVMLEAKATVMVFAASTIGDDCDMDLILNSG